MTLQEMIAARQQLLADARALIDEISDETPEARAAELNAQHDAAMAEFDQLDADISRRERVAAAERSIEAGTRAAHDARNNANRPMGTQGDEQRQAEGDETPYEDAFFELMRAGGDVTALPQEVRNALRGETVEFTDEQRAQMTSPDTAGGFTVPTLLQTRLIAAMALHGPMYDGDITEEFLTTTGANMEFPTINDLDGRLEELPEGTEVVYDAGDAFVFGQEVVGAHLYATKFLKLSRTLMQDSNQAMVQVTSNLLAERAGRTANSKLTTGTGVNEPQGILVGASLGHTSVAPGALGPDDLIDHQHSVNPIYRGAPGVRWQMNDTTLKGVRKMKDMDGNYIWSAKDIKKGTPETLLGDAISINPDMPDIATGADAIVYGDHKKYMVRKVGNIIIGIAKEKFWPNLGLAAIMRFDGRVMDSRALKRLRIS